MKSNNAVSPGVVSPKCLEWVLDSSLVLKFVWQMVLKTNIHKVQWLVLYLTVGKEVEKQRYSYEMHTDLEGFTLILDLERNTWVEHSWGHLPAACAVEELTGSRHRGCMSLCFWGRLVATACLDVTSICLFLFPWWSRWNKKTKQLKTK